jgi:hypothetical protein
MQATSSTLAWRTSILDDCHRVVLMHLHANMKKMFENSDMAFQEFAEKAQTNTSQIRFMEAMSIIQRNCAHVEEVFYRKLGNDFKNFGSPEHLKSLNEMLQDEPLTLVTKEDADIQVAKQNMAATAIMGATQVLFALRQRLAVLNNGKQLEEHQMPASPVCLANYFHEAASILALEHQTRLIVYMLFDKFVLSKTLPMYEEYNQCLVKARLLPNLKYKVRKNPVTKSQSSGGQSHRADRRLPAGADVQDSDSQSLGDELFSNIMLLLSRRDRHLFGDAPESGTGGSSTGESRTDKGTAGNNHAQGDHAVTAPIPQTKLVSAIHQLQLQGQPDLDASLSAEQIVSSASPDREVISNLNARLSAERKQLFTWTDRRKIAAVDRQVIDLVGMMFEYLLNDKELASVAKVEICRLHTPYLKVAIIDKSIFTNVKHPAHDLLNTLTIAGTRWVFEDNLKHGIFPTLRNIIQRIIKDFDNDLGIFTEMLVLLQGKMRDLEIKAAALEQRTCEAAAGKERLGLSRNCAADAIESRVTGHQVPADVRKALGDIWFDKLMFIYLREAESDHSKVWSLAIKTIENIVWSVEPRTGDRERAVLRERLPAVRSQIEQAIEALDAYGRSDNEAQLALIRKFQEIALTNTGHGNHDTVCDDTSDEPARMNQAAIKGNTNPAEKHCSPEIEAVLPQVEQLVYGTWISIQKNPDRSPAHLKLSWSSKTSGDYLFVDAMGIKAAVMTRIELATLIAAGEVSIIGDDQPSFVQGAIESIRRILSGEV